MLESTIPQEVKEFRFNSTGQGFPNPGNCWTFDGTQLRVLMRPSWTFLWIPVPAFIYRILEQMNNSWTTIRLKDPFFLLFFPQNKRLHSCTNANILTAISKCKWPTGNVDTHPSRIKTFLVRTQHLADYSFNIESTQAFHLLLGLATIQHGIKKLKLQPYLGGHSFDVVFDVMESVKSVLILWI